MTQYQEHDIQPRLLLSRKARCDIGFVEVIVLYIVALHMFHPQLLDTSRRVRIINKFNYRFSKAAPNTTYISSRKSILFKYHVVQYRVDKHSWLCVFLHCDAFGCCSLQTTLWKNKKWRTQREGQSCPNPD